MIKRQVLAFILSVSAASVVLSPGSTSAQSARKSTEKGPAKIAFNPASYDSAMLSEFAWRPIGPAVTSGRIVDLAVAEIR